MQHKDAMRAMPSTDTVRIALNGAAFPALGTEVTVLVTDPVQLWPIVQHVRQCIDVIDRTLSRFRPDSELARLERIVDLPQPASPLFLEALELALRAARDTEGWFDPTIRDALEAAGYDRSIEQLEAVGPGPNRPALPAGQWLRIRYNRALGWVCIPRGVRLDFGGIGKGFAVDYALRTLPVNDVGVLLNAGGDLAVRGPTPPGGWLCDIAVDVSSPPEAHVVVFEGALATSGLGRRQWTRNGERLHHLIDPRTGLPGVSPWRIVTVAARSCAVAEVAAKVAWLKGEEGPAWLEDLGLAGRFAAKDGSVITVGPWPEQKGDIR
ncbi:FAD:protein FMN transferase [Thermorudis peleae]|uniref:FAD:protein FMN transferase n=1 Tax=Thermorudis peleae TaxID=1382356 RepID=UPI00068EBB3A|nr:FAD:protein FMN transferase [Thermorudis peleae]